MGGRLSTVARHIGGLIPGAASGRRLRDLSQRLDRVEHLVRRLEYLDQGSSATYVGGNRVLLRLIAGRHLFFFYVQADDKLISPSLIVNGRYEPEITAFFVERLRTDSHCIDVGANLGYFTCLFAKHCPEGRVIGLEPNPVIHALTVDNVLVNGLGGHAQILNVAASDAVGELTLFHRIGRAGNTSLAACGEDFTRAFQEPPEEAFTIPTIRVDDLRDRLGGRVDFLKIDVEGAEPLALTGARETVLANPQLQIVMEWSPAQVSHAGFDVAEFVRDMAALRLGIHVIGHESLTPISQSELVGLTYQSGILLSRPPA